ncbi:diguanylate cyclase domain-containing protein [Bacillus xiapuensis]|uniref:diguanylate cyclase domain-containing protein n=1 Tax=Bacillus xiapuensis TaxID=2014075 RepID=UPI000C24594A|nr:diguanylate cyclase [Bacillus xiapuensis]
MGKQGKDGWLSAFKMKLFDLIVHRRHLLSGPEQFEKEWIRIICKLFQAKQYQLCRTDRLQEECGMTSEQFESIKQAFVRPFIKGSFIFGEKNVGFRFIHEDEDICLFLQADEKLLTEWTDEDFLLFIEENEKFMALFKQLSFRMTNEERYKELFNVTEKFHASLDIEYVLGEILSTLKRVFPAYSYHFLLAIEDRYNGIPSEHFNFERASEQAMSSYINGTVQQEQRPGQKSSILYAPLIGKQGIYGVLQVKVPADQEIPESERGFIRILANTGGSAIEKAKLYEQSRQLIADLQLINETSHKLNSSLRFTDITEFLHAQITQSFQASAVGFVFMNGANLEVLPGSSEFFYHKEGELYIRTVAERIQKEKDAMFVGELGDKWGNKTLPYRSLIAVPMTQSNELKGFCIVLKKESYGFTFETYKLLQSLIHHSTLALTNAMLREKLELLVITDHLTKLYARNYLDQAITESSESDQEGAFLLIDIDDFKAINDTYGHQTGDDTIIQVAELIRRTIEDHDVAARWGGEELAVYLPGKSLEAGIRMASELVKKVARCTSPPVTISCGVSHWSRSHPVSIKKLFNRADEALYKAKSTGKNKVSVFEEE